ncbi:MAG: AAA family ATPase, partial [Proteobacteria bacterium]
MKRYLLPQIQRDLEKKMVFLSGPRQVGKSTLARSLLIGDSGYMNWDTSEGRDTILSRNFEATPLLVFDELHKYRTWRNYLKGIYDSPARKAKILVTGSARLDLFRRGGDSLQGRYHLLTLFPLSFAELGMTSAKDLDQLLTLGGFPEPFLCGSAEEARRWSREYRTRVLRDEVTSIEQIVDLGNLELLMQRLPALVGSPLSLNAIREDIQVSHGSIRRWMDALERLYFIVRLSPFGSTKIKAV